jgi:hypothetical protein
VTGAATLDALLVQRAELERRHAEAVAQLETLGPLYDANDGHLAITRRRTVADLYDEIAKLQKRIDAHLAKDRARL